MEREQIIRMQKKFSGFHKLLVIFILVYNVERVINSSGNDLFLASIIAVVLLIADYVLMSREDVKQGHILVLRYIQVCVSMFFLVQSDYIYTFALSLICLSLFVIEYYLTFDFNDSYYRVIYVLTIGVPLEMLALLFSVLNSKIDERLFSLVFILGIYICIITLLANMFAKLISDNDERIFAQTRLIDNVNEANEALRINQEKVKKANEMLGVQKIKLEAAYNKINSVNSEMLIQNEIVKYISSSLELGKVMTLITESILNEIGVDVCAIVLFPNATESKKSSYKVRTRLSGAFVEQLSQAIEDQCFSRYLSLEGSYVDNHVEEDKYDFLKKGLIGSLMIVPLIKCEAIIGCLFVGHPKYDYFTENIGFFEGIVGQFLVALDNANLYARMESMAVRDGLTGIYNRRHLTRLFNENLNESIINKSPLSVALFDIDHFKNVNDTYGHLFGDVVIQTIASLAAQLAERYDGIVGRYGGEEFVIIFPGKGLREAYEPVSLLHQQVKELDLVHNGQRISVKVSVGITSYPETCKNPTDLLNRADWAMYYSKQNGRDRITIDNDDIREQVMLI